MHGIQDQKDVDQIFAPGGAIEAFEGAKKAGKCRFFGFTGHHDPNAHVSMLKAYDKWDSIHMPLHAADPAYLSFEKITLPVARGANGIDGTLSAAPGGPPPGPPPRRPPPAPRLERVPDRARVKGSLTIVLINNRGSGIFEHL